MAIIMMKKTLVLTALLTGVFLLTSCGNASAGNQDAGSQLPNSESAEVTVSEEALPEAPAPNETQTENPETASMEELVIGILPAESSIPLILAQEKGFFEAAGVSVTLQAFSSPNDRNAAVQSMALDGAIGDVMTAAAFADNGIPMKITSDISEDFKILSSPNSGITSMEQFDGKSISLVPNFILEYIMDEFALEHGFSYEIVEIPSFAGRSEALMSDQIDGVVFTEPQAGMLQSQGAYILGSSKEAGIKGGVLMFLEETIANHPKAIEAFYTAYNAAIDYMNETDASEYSDLLVQYQFPEAITGYLASQNGTFAHAGSIPEDQFNNIIAWAKGKELITKSYTYQELTEFSLLP